MEPRVTPLHAALELNTRLFLNCLDRVSDETARTRPDENTNSIAYIALHMHDARHYLAKYLGNEEPNPFKEITESAQGIDDITVYPSLAETRTAWMEISLVLERCLTELTEEQIDRQSPPDAPAFPVDDKSILGGIAFLLQHEAFHIGQMALLRKQLGHPAMSWEV
jgi:uncharacterized damage-inducible protein DinB